MVEPILSEEVVAPPQMALGPAPMHTHPEHCNCVYYVITAEIAPDLSTREFIEMECPHGFSASGAWYNEDYVRALIKELGG